MVSLYPNRKKNPCYECTERHVGCHSDCGRYVEWKAEDVARKELHRAEHIGMRAAADRKKDFYFASMRKRHSKG